MREPVFSPGDQILWRDSSYTVDDYDDDRDRYWLRAADGSVETAARAEVDADAAPAQMNG